MMNKRPCVMSLKAIAFCIVASFMPLWATASDYPQRPLRWVVGFPPGGGSDVAARVVGQALSELMHHAVVVDNRPGGGGNIATDVVAHANADGYTLLVAGVSFAIAPGLFKNLSFDTRRDFKAVVNIASTPFVLVVHPLLGVRTVDALIQLARTQPGRLNYASAGNGSTVHLAVELFKMAAHVDVVHVPYKGVAGIPDLLAGTVQMTITAPLVVMGHVKNAKLRALATTSVKRSALVPELPTLSESELKGCDVDSWYGLLVPAKTAPERINFINQSISTLLKRKSIQEQLFSQGLEAVAVANATPFSTYLEMELEKWARVVKMSGIQPE